MKPSEQAYSLIKLLEGFRAQLYNDQAGHCTIGYGHLVHRGPIDGRVEEAPFRNGITEEMGCELLRQDVAVKAEPALRQFVHAPLNQNQYDALVSFVFNEGAGGLQHSTLLLKLNSGDFAAVPAELMRWDKEHINGQVVEVEGLKTRRAREAALFMRALDPPAIGAQAAAV